MIATKNDANVKLLSAQTITVSVGDSFLHIRYPDVTYSYWKSRIPFKDDGDIITILMNLLVYLDCTIVFSNQRLLTTTNMMYEYHISEYYYYLLHIENQYVYNKYFNRLIIRHEENIKFEHDNPIIVYTPKPKVKKESKPKGKGKFVRQITEDMFSGKESYIYSNSTTGETINSDDPNLLDSLNGVKVKKEKKVKSVGVPMTSMTFSFKKKDNG